MSLDADAGEYWVRKLQLRQQYLAPLEVVQKTLLQSRHNNTDKATELKTDRFLENVARILRLLDESPGVDKARELSSLDRAERYTQTNVMPVLGTIVALRRKRACALKGKRAPTRHFGSCHADLEPARAFWTEQQHC
jgi:hypothetical protein